ncbi:thermonuclease family protein [Bradyrhizobium yuanmingense]
MSVASFAVASDLTGRASIIDGDTLEIRGSLIRLWGIDAPEHDQLCRGADSTPYHCGAKAANKLDRFIVGRPVSCSRVATDRHRRTVAVCSVDGVDLAGWLVSQGHALDWPRFSTAKYRNQQ